MTVVLAGCTVGPDYHRPEPQVAARWSELPASTTQPASQPAAALPPLASVPTHEATDDLSQWWRTLSDSTLDRLIERAVAQNLNLRIAAARIREARALRDIVAGGEYPTVVAGGSYSRQQPSENGQLGQVAKGPIGIIGGSQLSQPFSLFQAGFDASWELDLFGGVRRGIEAADANTTSAVEQHRDALVTIVAEVARVYVSLRGVQRRLAIAKDNLASERATLELVQNKRSAGVVSELDVNRAAAQVSLGESQLPLIERQIQRAIIALGVLLNEDTAAMRSELETESPLPLTPAEIPIGLPADLLRRRPDIRQAERTLAATTAQIGVATADLFPRITLGGKAGLEGLELSDLSDWGSRTFTFGPSIRWPLLEGGRIRANIRAQGAKQEQALAHYEEVVRRAVAEVEEALVTYTTEQARRQALAGCVESSRQAVELARLGYEGGATDLLAVLDAQRTQYSALDALAEADQTVVTTLVALYKALGGGWEVTEP